MGLEVATVAAISTVLAAGGTAATIAIQQDESRKASNQTKRAGRAQAAALRAEASAERERGRRLAASQRAAFGAAGVTSSGSPLLVQAAGLLDNLRARERLLAGARNVQSNSNAEADALRIRGLSNSLEAATNFALDFTPASNSATTRTLPSGGTLTLG